MKQFSQKSQQNQEGKMLAVDRARSLICAIPVQTETGESRAAWLRRVADWYRVSEALIVRLYYRQKKRIDADTLEGMLGRYEARMATLAALKEQANANQSRLNDLIYLGHDFRSGRVRPTDGNSFAETAGSEPGAGSSGDLREEVQPAAPAVRSTR